MPYRFRSVQGLLEWRTLRHHLQALAWAHQQSMRTSTICTHRTGTSRSNAIYGSTRPFPTLPASSPILPSQCTAPHPLCSLGNINQVNSGGNSNYNALWATINKHLSHGLELLGSYTYSKSFDYNSLSTGET